MRAALVLGACTALFVVATHLLGLGARLGPGLAVLGDRMVVASYAGAALLGVFNLARVHGRRILARRNGWGNSLLLLGGLFGFGAAVLREGPAAAVPDWVFLHVLSPLYASMYGMVAFFITSAAYRAFRARTAENLVLLLAAVVVMLGETPLGGLWSPLGAFTGWLVRVPVTGAYRAIQIGATLGALGMALRVACGIERTHIGG